jgi:hypothetical protein
MVPDEAEKSTGRKGLNVAYLYSELTTFGRRFIKKCVAPILIFRVPIQSTERMFDRLPPLPQAIRNNLDRFDDVSPVLAVLLEQPYSASTQHAVTHRPARDGYVLEFVGYGQSSEITVDHLKALPPGERRAIAASDEAMEKTPGGVEQDRSERKAIEKGQCKAAGYLVADVRSADVDIQRRGNRPRRTAEGPLC